MELIKRINTLHKDCTAQWGKMNVYQMTRHCTFWEEWIQGLNKHHYKQEFLGLIFGKIALRSMVKDDKPLAKNVPTIKAFKVKELTGDLEAEKQRWMSLIRGYEFYSNPDFVHDFFGKMTVEQIGILAYKHSDHHLRQFHS